MTPYETEQLVTIAEDEHASQSLGISEDMVALDFPGRCVIDRVAVVRIGGGAIAVDFFNRNFTSKVSPIKLITNDGNGFCQLRLFVPIAFRVGDRVMVHDTSVSAYNTSHRITARIDDQTYVTNRSFSTEAVGGNDPYDGVFLDIPAAEQPLYKVMDTLSGTNNAEAVDLAKAYICMDPLPNLNTGINRKLYLRFGAAGTYKVAIRAHASIGVSG